MKTDISKYIQDWKKLSLITTISSICNLHLTTFHCSACTKAGCCHVGVINFTSVSLMFCDWIFEIVPTAWSFVFHLCHIKFQSQNSNSVNLKYCKYNLTNCHTHYIYTEYWHYRFTQACKFIGNTLEKLINYYILHCWQSYFHLK